MLGRSSRRSLIRFDDLQLAPQTLFVADRGPVKAQPVRFNLPGTRSLNRDSLLVARPESPFRSAIFQLKLSSDFSLPIPDVKAHGVTFDFAVRDRQYLAVG